MIWPTQHAVVLCTTPRVLLKFDGCTISTWLRQLFHRVAWFSCVLFRVFKTTGDLSLHETLRYASEDCVTQSGVVVVKIFSFFSFAMSRNVSSCYTFLHCTPPRFGAPFSPLNNTRTNDRLHVSPQICAFTDPPALAANIWPTALNNGANRYKCVRNWRAGYATCVRQKF